MRIYIHPKGVEFSISNGVNIIFLKNLGKKELKISKFSRKYSNKNSKDSSNNCI